MEELKNAYWLSFFSSDWPLNIIAASENCLPTKIEC